MTGPPKRKVEDLAVLGGSPAFAEPLHVGRPNIGDRASLMRRIEDMLDRKWLTNNGKYVCELEKGVAGFLGVKHCIAMCNGTIALEIALRAVGMRGEVLVPSFTFVATVHALQWQEITPVFCDIDPVTCTIDPARLEEMVTPRTTGVIGVHMWGRACDVAALEGFARKRNLHLVFDAAHAFGCTYGGRKIGSFGDAEVFSFHATKFFNTFEGGAVVTNDDRLAAKIRLMKNFGFSGYDNVIYIGTNGKMSEVAAAMGVTNLESIESFVEVNRANYRTYAEGLSGVPGIRLLSYPEREKSNYQYVILDVDRAAAGIGRDQIVALLQAEKVLARRYFHPGSHRMEPYRSYFPHAGLLLPETERLSARVISLPTGTSVGAREIDAICSILRFAVEHAPEIGRRVP